MAITRAKRETNYTVVSNVGLRDKTLSLKAKGLLAYMLSLPDDWVFYESELTNHSTDGKASIKTALKELENNGYLVRKQERDSKGKFSTNDWIVYDEPLSDFRLTDKRLTEKPSSDNQPLLNTNKPITKELITDDTNISPKRVSADELFKPIWKLYPKKTMRKEGLASFKKALKNGSDADDIKKGVERYAEYLESNKSWLKPMDGGRWFQKERWNDEYDVQNKEVNPYEQQLGF